MLGEQPDAQLHPVPPYVLFEEFGVVSSSFGETDEEIACFEHLCCFFLDFGGHEGAVFGEGGWAVVGGAVCGFGRHFGWLVVRAGI